MAPAATTTWRASIDARRRRGRCSSTPVARRPSVADARDEGLGQQLGPARGHHPLQQGDRVALGVDGAAEEGAEPAVVAGRAAVVGDAVGGGGGRVGVVAEPLGGRRRQGGAVHGRPRGHRVGPRAPGGERVGPVGRRPPRWPAPPRRSTARARRSRGASRPPRRRAGDRGPTAGEVLLPEPRHLAVGVGAPARRRWSGSS